MLLRLSCNAQADVNITLLPSFNGEGTVCTDLEYGGPLSGSEVAQALELERELERLHPGHCFRWAARPCRPVSVG